MLEIKPQEEAPITSHRPLSNPTIMAAIASYAFIKTTVRTTANRTKEGSTASEGNHLCNIVGCASLCLHLAYPRQAYPRQAFLAARRPELTRARPLRHQSFISTKLVALEINNSGKTSRQPRNPSTSALQLACCCFNQLLGSAPRVLLQSPSYHSSPVTLVFGVTNIRSPKQYKTCR